jgi:hypothetical protein
MGVVIAELYPGFVLYFGLSGPNRLKDKNIFLQRRIFSNSDRNNSVRAGAA